MKRSLIKRTFFGSLLVLAGSAAFAADAPRPARIVSVGGSVTETVYALGAQEALVGVDTSSTYPEAASKLPQCGYQRTLSAEGVVSLKPDFVILAGGSGPASAIEQLKKLGVPMVKLSDEHSLEAAQEHILQIGSVLGREKAARQLAGQIEKRMAEIPKTTDHPRVLFVLSRGGGSALVSGKGTAADAMIRLAGGKTWRRDWRDTSRFPPNPWWRWPPR
jgi:iron complex transport system substrate-binding protein